MQFHGIHKKIDLSIIVCLLWSVIGYIPSSAQSTQYPIVINEIMASNSFTISDEDGDYEDWIELYNQGTEAINLEGWGLSDDETNLFRWVFPGVTIQPGEFLLVWASGKDRRPDVDEMINGIRREVYHNISGNSVDDLLASPDYPDNPSESHIVTDYFEAPINIADNYGQRMHGLFKAPVTGNFTFWISSDDNSWLLLSSNSNPDNAELIAEVPAWTSPRQWDKFPEQQSEPVSLIEGEYYYLAALMKEGHGGDNLALRMRLPNGIFEEPISASHFYIDDAELHTNFSISSDGEPILLTHPSDGIIHMAPSTIIPRDISYGLKPGEEGFYFFNEPTPGSANTTLAYGEIIDEEPVFSHTGGFFEAAFELSITTDYPGASIYYTLDGSVPDPSNLDGTTYEYQNQYPLGTKLTRDFITEKYNEPLFIEDRSPQPYELGTINPERSFSTREPSSNYFKGTVVRAIVHKENALNTKTATHTYFITPEATGRYNLPVISIATDEPNLYDYETGIYVAGKVADDTHIGGGWNGGYAANYNQRGIEWEKPAHFEYFPNGAQPAYRQNIGIRTHGGWSRAFYRKSLRLYARNAYDDRNTFEYPFFGELPSKVDPNIHVDAFRRVILRNSGNDFDRTNFRDALIQDLVKHLSFTTMAYQPVIHFINGEYWGIINMRERYDQHYIHSHYGVETDDVAILEVWGSVDTGLPNDRDHFDEIVNFAESNNLSINLNYNSIKERVDVENLAQYYAVQIYIYNTDWPQNNMTFWRKRTDGYIPNAPEGHDGRWRWMLYDTDFGMNLYGTHQHLNGLNRVMTEASDPSSRLFRQLLQNNTFRNLFINIVADQINSCFKPNLIHAKVDEFNQQLSPYRSEHRNRWRSGDDQGGTIKTFATHRPSYALSHTQSQFSLSSTAGLSVNTTGTAGKIQVNSLLIDENTPGLSNPDSPYPWTGNYFQNVPIRLKAIPDAGSRFVRWMGVSGVDVQSPEIEITITGNTSVVAQFEEAPKPELIHYWHFNDLPDNLALMPFNSDFSNIEEMAGISYHGSGDGYMDRVNDGTTINLRNEAPVGSALRVRNPSHNRELVLELPTNGYQQIVMNYAVSRTTNGAREQSIEYRTSENGHWIPFMENIVILPDFQLITADFSHIKGAEDNPHFAVRVGFTDEHATNASGNNRFDNVSLEGFPLTGTTVSEESYYNSISIFPNPATDLVNVVSQDRITAVNLYSIDGKLLFRRPGNDFTLSVDVADISRGIYLMEVITGSGNDIQRVFIR